MTRKFGKLILLLMLWHGSSAQQIYLGTTMGMADHHEKNCGIAYKEDNLPADPYLTLANHGANIVRLRIDLPPYANSYSNWENLDFRSAEKIKVNMQRAKDAGLKTLLTFSYQSVALEDSQKLNPYVAPLGWQGIASELDKITDSVYHHTYTVLDDYCGAGLIPEIVSIGNESVWRRLELNIPEDQLPDYDPARSVAIHNAGSRAVRDISIKYDTAITVCFHMMGPARTKWWLEEHSPYGLDFDMIGISLYHGWNNDDFAGFNTLGEYVSYIIDTYKIDFIIMETAQLFTSGGNDSHVDILGTENIPLGYANPPTTETQKQYLIDVTKEVLENGGAGVLVWGGEWVASNCYVYADQWGPGSSWENKAFWDFDNNLHDGVNWMMAFSGKVPVTFKVDMEGMDVSRGVYVTGDFENFQGESWAFNPMTPEGYNVHAYTVYIYPNSSGAFYFLNDTVPGARESVPLECALQSGTDRRYDIPSGSAGEIYAFKWAACDSIPQFLLKTSIKGQGYTSPAGGIYSRGTQISITATPAIGWLFSGWSGDTSSASNPLTLEMVSEWNVTATFVENNKVTVKFEVDMTGVDASRGVYVTGEFPDHSGKIWQLNKMTFVGNHIYRYATQVSVGTSGAYYFLNDDQWGEREGVPAGCAVYWGTDRGYVVPVNSAGETFAYKWSSCEEIKNTYVRKIPNVNDPLEITIFPNPIRDQWLWLSVPVYRGDLNISVYNTLGMLQYKGNHKVIDNVPLMINLAGLTQGLYIIKVVPRDLESSSYDKLIISR
jgi:arabinogalactan endo-1,4-beta-galactosidase